MKRTAVINIVGLTRNLLGEHTPNLNKLLGNSHDINPITPAVTCSAQATYLTGKSPSEHGIVANGWYFRNQNEVWLWRQSNKLIQIPKIWENAQEIDPSFTCANTFWWYAMATSADITLTPRPLYCADGRKLPDCYTYPLELRNELTEKLGKFPLFQFWGPATSIKSSQWIANSAKIVEEKYSPTLQLIYLPHLDYCLQRKGPKGDITQDLRDIDRIAGNLIEFFTEKNCHIIALSEYGISQVDTPIHPNRILREANMLSLKIDEKKEYLDFATCKAFAVADHQIAHIYINDPDKLFIIKTLFEKTPGIAKVLDKNVQKAYGIAHERSGELVLLAEPNAWFTYYYWHDDKNAPDFAPTIDIHKKPGYDPCELFLNKNLLSPKLSIASKLIKKYLGFRYTMDVISMDATQVKGSHGTPLIFANEEQKHDMTPIFMSTKKIETDTNKTVEATDIHDMILAHIFE